MNLFMNFIDPKAYEVVRKILEKIERGWRPAVWEASEQRSARVGERNLQKQRKLSKRLSRTCCC